MHVGGTEVRQCGGTDEPSGMCGNVTLRRACMSEVQQNGGTSKRELPQQTAVSHGAEKIPIVHQRNGGTAERMERRNESTNGAGTEMRDPAEGDCGFALLPPRR